MAREKKTQNELFNLSTQTPKEPVAMKKVAKASTKAKPQGKVPKSVVRALNGAIERLHIAAKFFNDSQRD